MFSRLVPSFMGGILGFANLAIIGAASFLLFATAAIIRALSPRLPSRRSVSLGVSPRAPDSPVHRVDQDVNHGPFGN